MQFDSLMTVVTITWSIQLGIILKDPLRPWPGWYVENRGPLHRISNSDKWGGSLSRK